MALPIVTGSNIGNIGVLSNSPAIKGGTSENASGQVLSPPSTPIPIIKPAVSSIPSNTTATVNKTGATNNSVTGGSTTSGPTASQIAAQNEYNNQNSADQATINSLIGTSAGDYNQSILDLMNSNKNSQATIDSTAVQNQLARDQGLQGVTDMVHNGIQGGAVQIDDAGGGTSSAGQQLAQDYGIVGRQASSQVGNQFAQGQNSIASQQSVLNNNEATSIGDLNQKKSDTINGIVSSANQSLSYLDSLAQSAGVANIPNILDQINQVKAQATAALSAYDSELGSATAIPLAQPDIESKAQGLFAAGTAPTNAFNFTTTAPATLGAGPSPSPLPIFIAPKNNNDTTQITA